MLRNANGPNIHPQRPRKARPDAGAGERRGVLHAKTARPRRGALRQKTWRGGGRGGDCRGRRRPRARDRRSRRRALPSPGRAARPRHHARRSRGRARRAYAAVGPRREGGAQERLDTMEQRTEQDVSPYRAFSRAEWATLRQDTPMTLEPSEVTRLRSMHDRLDMSEVEDIYLPLSRLLSLYVAATQNLFRAQQGFLGTEDTKMPYIIGVGGSVAAGKSTTARVLQALLARWPNVPKVDLITTDGFLFPNAVLDREGLMEKKGFPESYDLPALLLFLSDIKAGRRPVRAPVYSHLIYDVIPNQWIEIDRPEILIVEGLNVLQAGRLPRAGKAVPFVSAFFDFSLYLAAEEEVVLSWDVSRFLTLRGTAFADPKSYFHRYAQLSDKEAAATATSIWNRINLVNLHENILPTRQRADLILTKGESHQVDEVALRRL